MVLRDAGYIRTCKGSEYVTLLNAHARVYKNFLRIEIDKWGLIKPCEDPELIESVGAEVRYDQDWSKVEYELVESKTPAQGGRGRGAPRGK